MLNPTNAEKNRDKIFETDNRYIKDCEAKDAYCMHMLERTDWWTMVAISDRHSGHTYGNKQ